MQPTSLAEILAIILVWQALLFAVLFMGLYIQTKDIPKKFIACFMLVNVGYFGVNWLVFFGHLQVLWYVYPFATPLLLCNLPVFYWYIRSLSDPNFRVSGKQWLHLLPALILLVPQLSFFMVGDYHATELLEKSIISRNYSILGTFLTNLDHVTFYILFTGQFAFYYLKYRKIISSYNARIGNVYSYTENINLKWLRKLKIGILLFFIGHELSHSIEININMFSSLYFSIGMIGILFYIGYHGLLQGKGVIALYSREQKDAEEDTGVILSPASADGKRSENTEPQRYKKSALKSDMRSSIIDNLKRLMKEDELFSDTKLSIDDVARRLGVNSKYLSQSINEEFNCNFYNYVNELRVERAKVFLVAGPHDHFSIEGISNQVGFQSKSSFYSAFKRITGLTPTAFRAKAGEKLDVKSVFQDEQLV